ncbi:hypothetical protein WMY93_033788 [Mugilogobius chulae]|uniref:C-type lectin domain-containing protein n=1 Tax=Mugilogobius chulae TaxID=88201 RepID=A0AAW0MRT0_9GOBI
MVLIVYGPHSLWSSQSLVLTVLVLIVSGPHSLWSSQSLVLTVSGPHSLWSSQSLVLTVSGPHSTNPKQLFKVTTYLSWSDAQQNCRTSYTDLVLIESEAENLEVVSHTNNYLVWVDSPKASWNWSDHSTFLFTNWISYLDVPDTCVAEDETHGWKVLSCSQRLPFFCYDLGNTHR